MINMTELHCINQIVGCIALFLLCIHYQTTKLAYILITKNAIILYDKVNNCLLLTTYLNYLV